MAPIYQHHGGLPDCSLARRADLPLRSAHPRTASKEENVTGQQDPFQRPLPFRRIKNFLGKAGVAQLLNYAEAQQSAFEPTRLVRGALSPEI
jgi:hypothetical protein